MTMLPTPTQPQSQTANSPRKRSKVSRACDSCRSRKMRCNAEFSQNLNAVTKPCDRCIKHSISCLFSRVPLKRGPLKGFQRDNGHSSHSRRVSIDEPRPAEHQPRRFHSTSISSILNYPNGDPQSSPVMHSASIPVPQLAGGLSHSPKLINFQQSMNNRSPPIPQQAIILPPIMGPSSTTMQNTRSVGSDHKDSKSLSQPPPLFADAHSRRDSISLSPPPRLINHEPSQPVQGAQILGPFWKVPYEMPGQSGNFPFGGNRRSSIDSVLSGVSFPSARYLGGSVASDLAFESDSDDYYTVRLNSVSSHKISASAEPPAYPSRSHGSAFCGQRSRGHSIGSIGSQGGVNGNLISCGGLPVPVNNFPTTISLLPLGSVDSLENNIQKYYRSFHAYFAILYFDEARTYALVRSQPSLVKSKLCESLNLSLHCLIYFKQISLQEKIQVLLGVLAQYPFTGVAEDGCIVLLFASLLAVNYSIFLNGDHYLAGLTALMSMLHEFRALDQMQLVCGAAKAKGEVLDCDDTLLLLPRHYFCLAILDGLYALQRGTEQSGNYSTGRMARMPLYLDQLFSSSEEVRSSPVRKLFQTHTYIQEALKNRDTYETCSPTFCLPQTSGEEDLAAQFASLMGFKHQLHDFLLKMESSAQAICATDATEHHTELLHDDVTKLLRILRMVTLILIKIKVILTSFSMSVYHPLFNISVAQLYKLTRVVSSTLYLIDQLCVMCPSHAGYSFADFAGRCQSIKGELSQLESDPGVKQFSPWLGAVALKTILENTCIQQLVTEIGNGKPQNFMAAALHWAQSLLRGILPTLKNEACKGWL